MWTLLVVGLVMSWAAEVANTMAPGLVTRSTGLQYVGSSTAVKLDPPAPPRCLHNCQYIGNYSDIPGQIDYFYEVDSRGIVISYESFNLSVDMNCNGSSVLSSAEPYFQFEDPQLRTLKLRNCTLLAGSLGSTFTAINISSLDVTSLFMLELPAEPPLNAKHFTGLGNVNTLHIAANNGSSAKSGFLKPLQRLRTVFLWNVTLPGNELDELVSRKLEVHYYDVDTLWIAHWTERKPVPMTRCNLRKLHLTALAADKLPERWLENCSRLTELVIQDASNLAAVPAQLLFGANAVTDLSFRSGVLTSLPVGWLNYTSGLLRLKLDGNRLRKLPNDTFSATQHLQELDLSSNKLETLPTGLLSNLTKILEIKLDGNRLRTLPNEIFSLAQHLEDLNLSSNILESLPTGMLSNASNLLRLRLDGNRLRTLPNDTFSVTQHLQELDLSSNALETLPTGLLSNLSNLLKLKLDGNRLRTLPNDMFSATQHLQELDLSSNALETLPAGLLSNVSNLLKLNLDYNRLRKLPNGIFSLAQQLEELNLSSNILETLPTGLLSNASNLLRLRLDGNRLRTLPNDTFSITQHLQELDLSSNALETLPTGLLSNLSNLLKLKLDDNRLRTLPNDIFSATQRLQEIDLSSNKLETIPTRMLSNASSLLKLKLDGNYLRTLPNDMLSVTLHLEELSLSSNILETVPTGLLSNASNLLKLYLDGNRLRTLPNDTFAVTWRLQELDLSSNILDNNAVAALAPLKELVDLSLAHNPRLTDVCKPGGRSPIRSTKLSKLDLNGINITRICRHWRENMTLLKFLDLTGTNIANLSFEDVQFTRDVDAEVLLLGVPVTVLKMTPEDFKNVTRRLRKGATVHLNATLDCDCRMYWTRRALGLSPRALQRIQNLTCEGGTLLGDLSAENMTCPEPKECRIAKLPPNCTCEARPDGEPLYIPRLMVHLRCEHASLSHVPHPQPPTNNHYKLFLSNNNITSLHADDLPPYIKALDIRNNLLTSVDGEAARRLGRITGMLRLAGNPLECGTALLQALRSRRDKTTDLKEATCRDGRRLVDAVFPPEPRPAPITSSSSPPGKLVVIFFTGLLGLALAILLCLLVRERRRLSAPGTDIVRETRIDED